jgi:nucleoid DNA-binding protein
MVRDDTINAIIKKVAEKASKDFGKEISEDVVFAAVNFQFKIARNCIRGGTNVRLRNFGKFKLMDAEGTNRNAIKVTEAGGYANALKIFEADLDGGKLLEEEVVYNPDFFGEGINEYFNRDSFSNLKKPVDDGQPKLKMFKFSLVGKMRNVKETVDAQVGKSNKAS